MADIMKYITAIFNFVKSILAIFEQDEAIEVIDTVEGKFDAVAGAADAFIGEIGA